MDEEQEEPADEEQEPAEGQEPAEDQFDEEQAGEEEEHYVTAGEESLVQESETPVDTLQPQQSGKRKRGRPAASVSAKKLKKDHSEAEEEVTEEELEEPEVPAKKRPGRPKKSDTTTPQHKKPGRPRKQKKWKGLGLNIEISRTGW